ncbi:hypothetical protein HK105_207522 [Polyrhizophydium stewartii]|uniref:Uncharacterized protein n=1 Tax=Polyrhizophydium stewartii TaxID=2732419 RepID=A0ABR4N0B3_9FUNG
MPRPAPAEGAPAVDGAELFTPFTQRLFNSLSLTSASKPSPRKPSKPPVAAHRDPSATPFWTRCQAASDFDEEASKPVDSALAMPAAELRPASSARESGSGSGSRSGAVPPTAAAATTATASRHARAAAQAPHSGPIFCPDTVFTSSQPVREAATPSRQLRNVSTAQPDHEKRMEFVIFEDPDCDDDDGADADADADAASSMLANCLQDEFPSDNKENKPELAETPAPEPERLAEPLSRTMFPQIAFPARPRPRKREVLGAIQVDAMPEYEELMGEKFTVDGALQPKSMQKLILTTSKLRDAVDSVAAEPALTPKSRAVADFLQSPTCPSTRGKPTSNALRLLDHYDDDDHDDPLRDHTGTRLQERFESSKASSPKRSYSVVPAFPLKLELKPSADSCPSRAGPTPSRHRSTTAHPKSPTVLAAAPAADSAHAAWSSKHPMVLRPLPQRISATVSGTVDHTTAAQIPPTVRTPMSTTKRKRVA